MSDTLREAVAKAMYSHLNIARPPWGTTDMHTAWLTDADVALAVIRERVAALKQTGLVDALDLEPDTSFHGYRTAIQDVLALLDGTEVT